MTADFWIQHLQLQPHPEGGFFKEVYRSAEQVAQARLPDRFNGPRSLSTSIYFLLRSQDRSLFHRIQSDELWHFYAGTSLTVYVIRNGVLHRLKLGNDPEAGEHLQLVVPANCWFAAQTDKPDSFTLVGCTVSPGFDFQDFEMGDRKKLLDEFPHLREIIESFTEQ